MINNIAPLPRFTPLCKCLFLIVNVVLSVTRHLCPVCLKFLLNEHKSAIHYPHFTRMLCWQKTEMARGLAKQVKVHSCTSACPQRSCQCCTSPEAPRLSTAPAMLVTRVRQASVSALDWLINHFSTFSAGRSIALFTCPYINWSVFSSAVLLLRDQFEMIHLWSLLLIYAGSCAFKCPV